MDGEIKTTPFKLTRESKKLLESWMEEREMSTSLLDQLPKLGLMVWCQNKPVAVCFIRQVEGGNGMIDGFLCDPRVAFKKRNECLDWLISDILKLAAFNNMTGLFGVTTNKRVVQRAKKLGWNILADHKVMSIRCQAYHLVGVQ